MSLVTAAANRLRQRRWDEKKQIARDIDEIRVAIAKAETTTELYASARELFLLAIWLDRNLGTDQARQLLDVLLPATLRLSDMTKSEAKTRTPPGVCVTM